MRVIGNLRVRIGADMSDLDAAVDRSISRTTQLSKTTDAAAASAARLTATSSTTAVSTNAAAAAAGRAALANVGVASAAQSAAVAEGNLATTFTAAANSSAHAVTTFHAQAAAQAEIKATAGLATPGLLATAAAAERGAEQMNYYAVANRAVAGEVSSLAASLQLLRGPQTRVQQLGDAFLRNNGVIRGGLTVVSRFGNGVNWLAGKVAAGGKAIAGAGQSLFQWSAVGNGATRVGAAIGRTAGASVAALGHIVRWPAALTALSGRLVRGAADWTKFGIGFVRAFPGFGAASSAISGLFTRLGSVPGIAGRAAAGVAKLGGSFVSTTASIISGAAKATAAVGLLGGALVAALVKKGLASASALGKNADALGITTESFRQLEHAARLEGIDPKVLTDGLGHGLEAIAKGALDAQDPLHRALGGIGLSVRELAGLAPDQQFAKIADSMQRSQDPANNLRAAYHLFGEEGMSLVNVLQNGSAGLQAAAADADKLGLSMNRVDSAKAELAHEAFDRLWASIATTAEKLAVFLAPALEMAANWLTDLRTTGGGAASILETGFGKVTDAIVWTLDTFESLTMLFPIAQQAVTGFIGSMLTGMANAIEGSTFFKTIVGGIVAAFRLAAAGAQAFFAFVLRSLASIVEYLPNLPKWLGGGKPAEWAASMRETADGLADAAQKGFEALKSDAAGDKLADGIIAGLRTAGQAVEEKAAAMQNTLTDKLAGRSLGSRFRDQFAQATKAFNDKAVDKATRAAKGSKIIAAGEKALAAAPKKELKYDNPFLDARGKEAYSAIVQHKLGKGAGQNPVEKNTKLIADTAKLQLTASRDQIAYLKNMVPINVNPVAIPP